MRLTAGLAAASWFRLPAVAGPFTRQDFEKLVPADKKLSPEWVRSLFERGRRAVYRWPDSRLIGLPIGGLCAGQLYLGGDGRLWHWDIFNQPIGTGAEHYAKPLEPRSPLDQGFALLIAAGQQTQVRALDHTGWSEVTFTGEYPLGFVEYRDPAAPVTVSLEAFSPFIPLNVEDSSLPATVMRFTVKNTSAQPVEVELAGWLENAVCLHSGQYRPVLRRNRVVRRSWDLPDQPAAVSGLTVLECSAELPPQDPAAPQRPDLLFDDFERERYETWTAEGAAFGPGPIAQAQMPAYQGQVGGQGRYVVNSHATAPGDSVERKDAATGALTSRPFTIERNYICFLIGGGAHQGRTCVNLWVEDQVVLSATGRNDNRMSLHHWDVRPWLGKTARLQVVDHETGPWGNIGLDHLVFTDQPRPPAGPLTQESDFGTLALALLREAQPRQPPASAPAADSSPSPLRGGEGRAEKAPATDRAASALPDTHVPAGLFSRLPADTRPTATRPFGQKLLGALSRKLALAPGESGQAVFLITWHFPNLTIQGVRTLDQARARNLPGNGRSYATRFSSAADVAVYVAAHFDRLAGQTRLWHDTWYDSTLPWWFLDRTFLNTSILATSTCHRFADGRFWAWEGVGCCAGTCGHVWQYAQAMARLFPELERFLRERIDFGLAQQPDGAIHFRGEHNNFPAVDGQAGTILRALREHQMSADATWLRRTWPGIKKATEWLIAKDGNGDGLIEGNQHNTLDTDWFGPVAWLSGLYLAALRAAEEMAREVGDETFARRCRDLFERGQSKLVAELFDGEYFINKPDPKHPEAINSGTGCHIDQVLGQSWAWQVGLGRVLPAKETLSALRSLWRYNFTPDVGPYRAVYKPGRWYALPGEGGLLMCTFPRKDWDYAQAKGQGPDWAAGYFNESMNGFEYQVAGHLIAEGLVREGLAVTRMVHDRYHPLRRNPWNEVECGDHYARSMASYGVFLAACGYEYHGPQGRLGFAPRLTPENFKCAFTAAEGWGSYRQKVDHGRLQAELAIHWGRLRLTSLSLRQPEGVTVQQVRVRLAREEVPARLTRQGEKLEVRFDPPCRTEAGQTLELVLS